MCEVIYPRLGCGDVFGPEDIAQLAAGLESALTDLGIQDRNDPTTTLVAKLIIQLAKNGDRNPTSLAKRAIGLCAALVRCGFVQQSSHQAQFPHGTCQRHGFESGGYTERK